MFETHDIKIVIESTQPNVEIIVDADGVASGLPLVNEKDNGKVLAVVDGKWAADNPARGGFDFETDDTLVLDENNILRVNTTNEATETDQRPITSQGIFNEFAVINALLKTI